LLIPSDYFMSECRTQRFRKLQDTERVVNRRSDNTMAKREKRKIGEAMIYKTLQRKLNN